jgi:hypothetical protein
VLAPDTVARWFAFKRSSPVLPPNTERVSRNTAESINERIRRRTDESVARCAAGGPQAIERRLAELDREWDVERCVETLAPTFTLAGLFLGVTGSRKWLLLPAAVQAFFLQHALQGWCPPVPVLRRFGVRTMSEIDEERMALKTLRGDFKGIGAGQRGAVRRAVEAARR